jgi:hypothetical protein
MSRMKVTLAGSPERGTTENAISTGIRSPSLRTTTVSTVLGVVSPAASARRGLACFLFGGERNGGGIPHEFFDRVAQMSAAASLT